MDAQVFKASLTEVQRTTNEQWLASLDARKKAELEFHDRNRDKTRQAGLDQDTYEKLYGNTKYYGAATRPSTDYISRWIEHNAKGRIFLDYACGNGVNALKAARAGAALSVGIDISAVSVQNATRAAAGLSNVLYLQADAENTKLPDNSVDAIICSGMLHHLDLSYAFPELRRILAPGGRILCVEALDYNPAIKLYRQLTAAMRTEWEKAHILSLKDVEFARRFFRIGDVRYWHVLSILGPHMKPLFPLLHAVDKVLTSIPMVQLMAWIFTFELVKE
jgi:SAM-dependent methyltransferase